MQPETIPLARLMATAFRSLIDSLHERLADRGWSDVRPAYGFVLLAARQQGTTATDIAALMGMTKQAASGLIATMEDAGYIRRKEHPDDARAKTLHLTARGRRLLDTVEAIYRELEDEWAAIIGRQALESMRRNLVTALEAKHGGTLPAVRPTW